MKEIAIATLLASMLLAGSAVAQVNPTTPKDRANHGAGHAASTDKGPGGVSRDGNVPSVNRRSDAVGSPGATSNSERLSAPSGASSSGATGTGSSDGGGGGSAVGRQQGSGLKSSGTAGSAGGSGASDAAGSGGMGGGATGGTMR